MLILESHLQKYLHRWRKVGRKIWPMFVKLVSMSSRTARSWGRKGLSWETTYSTHQSSIHILLEAGHKNVRNNLKIQKKVKIFGRFLFQLFSCDIYFQHFYWIGNWISRNFLSRPGRLFAIKVSVKNVIRFGFRLLQGTYF